MRMSETFGRTLRSSSAAPGSGQAWAERAALMRALPEGTAWLPLGERAKTRLRSSLLRALPAAQWLCLPPGPETSLWPGAVQGEVQSYRQVPARLAAHRVVVADSIGESAGGSTATDAFQLAGLCSDEAACSHAAEAWRARLETWGGAFRLELRAAEAGEDRVEVAADPKGEVRMRVCPRCGYAGVEAGARWARVPADRESPAERRRVATPGAHTIDLLASSLKIERSRTLKAVFLTDDLGLLTFAVVPGDLDVSLWKLGHLTGGRVFKPASSDQIRAVGAEPGYASPVGLHVQGEDDPQGVRVVVDSSVAMRSNFVAGANQVGYHFTGVNFPRDFRATLLGDIASAPEGAMCVKCGHQLEIEQGVAVGSWRLLNPPIAFADERGGQSQARLALGTVFLDPMLLAIIQASSDDVGIDWPAELAPYPVHLIDLKSMDASLEVEAMLSKIDLEILFDDRTVSTGVKFADADLIGCPVRITVSARSQAQGGAEVSGRRGVDSKIVPVLGLLEEVARRLGPNYVKVI